MESYFFNEELPLAIEYGMPLDEFWNGEYDLFFAYQKAYINKVHRQCHIQGLYNQMALMSVMGNMFKKKDAKPIEYPKEDVFNPFKSSNIESNNNQTLLSSIDTTKSNRELYQIKKMLKERRND